MTNPKPPREWTVLIDKHTGNVAFPQTRALPVDAIHVIEKSAYDAVVLENKEMKFELEAKQRPLSEQVLDLTRRNAALVERLREALKFEHENLSLCGFENLYGEEAEYVAAELAKVGVVE